VRGWTEASADGRLDVSDELLAENEPPQPPCARADSRIIVETQLWPGGVGAETKYSSTRGFVQNYVSIRLLVD
jgi:hypothetical protein